MPNVALSLLQRWFSLGYFRKSAAGIYHLVWHTNSTPWLPDPPKAAHGEVTRRLHTPEVLDIAILLHKTL